MKQLKKMGWVGLALLLHTGLLQAQQGNSIVGRWQGTAQDKPMQMEIYLGSDGLYYGKRIDGQPTATLVLKGLRYQTATGQYKGKMTPPDANMDINVTITIMGNDRLQLVGKKFLLTKTFYLQRFK
jgi:hypothetical protein